MGRTFPDRRSAPLAIVPAGSAKFAIFYDDGRIEALRGVIRWEQVRAVNVHQKQIVDRVFVLLAIQPVQQPLICDMLRGGKLVERIFEICNQ